MEENGRDFEAEATEQGWNPDYDGPNKTDAKTFVERGDQIAGILKKKNTKLEGRLHDLEVANQKFGEYHKATLEREQKKGQKQIAELQGELAQAITDGDGQAYTLKQQQIDDLKSSQADMPTDDAAAWNAMAQRWANDNQWYNQSRKMQLFADGLSDQLRGQGYNGEAYFSELSKQVREEFPEEFKNPNKSKANAVEDSGPKGSGNSKAKTYANLPADAKAACDDFASQGFMTKEDYVKQFEWDE